MKKISDTTWSEVFKKWEEREGEDSSWLEVAKQKGWDNWKEWREYTASQFDAESRDWEVFEFENPLAEVPEILIGPYTGWQKRFEQKNIHTFKDMIEREDYRNEFLNNPGLKSMMDAMPFEITFIGVRKADGSIVLIDGHHRATMMTILAYQGNDLDFSSTPIRIALTDLGEDADSILDHMLKKGTNKPA